MIIELSPSSVSGNLQAPSSKSMTQRAIAAGLLANRETRILNASGCMDSKAAMEIARGLGAEVEVKENEILVRSRSGAVASNLNCGESGLALRMFTPIAALNGQSVTITGKGSLLKRPVQMITDALQQLGVKVESNAGLLPIKLEGKLKGGHVNVDGSVSSQLLTGLLMALPVLKDDSVISVDNLKSKPYISMTLELLRDFGIQVKNEGMSLFKIPGNQKYSSRSYEVEGDWSGAAFLLVAGAVAGKIRLSGLNPHSAQADRQILEILELCGNPVLVGPNFLEIESRSLKSFEFDATECPDLFPPAAALGVFCEGTSRITGIERLVHKESDRAMAIVEVLSNLGIRVWIEGNDLFITGGQPNGGNVSSHNDHRIAMMAAVCALGAKAKVVINGAECVSKSYPEFYEDLQKIGVNINTVNL